MGPQASQPGEGESAGSADAQARVTAGQGRRGSAEKVEDILVELFWVRDPHEAATPSLALTMMSSVMSSAPGIW